MKTVLPPAIQTIEQAKDFLKALHDNDEAFHPEDDAHDITWRTCEPTDQEKDVLNRRMSEIYDLPGAFDPCGYLLELMEADIVKK